MRLLANKLRDALSIISLVPSRAGIMPSEFVRMSAAKGQLTLALAAELFGEVPLASIDLVGETWVFFAERRLLSAFVNACNDAKDTDEIVLEFVPPLDLASTGTLKIKYKRRRAVLQGIQGIQEITGYGRNSGKDMSPITLTDEHKALIRLAAKYAPMDPTAADLNCVYLLKGHAVQSSNQVVIFSATDLSVPLTMPFPLMLPELLSNQAITGIQVGDKGTRITFTSGYLFQLINEKCRTDFPSKKILGYVADAAKIPILLSFKPGDLLTILQRLQTYTSSSAGSVEVTVQCKGTAGKRVVVLTSKATQGYFNENMTIDQPLAADMTCEWPLAHLLPFTEFVSNQPTMSVAFGATGPFDFHSTVGGAELDLIIARKTI